MKKYAIPALMLSAAMLFAACSSASTAGSVSDSAEDSEKTTASSSVSSFASASQSSASSASAADEPAAQKSEASSIESMTSAAASAAKENPALQAVPLANFEDLKKAFTDNGFTVSNTDTGSGMELSFTAENDNGTVMVSAFRLADKEDAKAQYEKEVEQLGSEDYQSVETKSSEAAELKALVNDYNSVYGYVGVDYETDRVYVFQDVLDGNRNTCQKIFEQLGFLDLKTE